jgi:ferric-dicitrate binding protein FerR (iron transport regulator)
MEEYIYGLIAGALNGELDEGERQSLQQWLDADEEHQRLFARMQSIHARARALYPARATDVERALREVKRERRARVRTRIAWYAAAVVLVSGAGWWFANHRAAERVDPRAFEQVSAPGRPRAVLRQEGEREIALGETLGDTLLSSLGGVTVSAGEERSLTYSIHAGVTPDDTPRVDELIVPRGGEFRLELSDGSIVTLNAESRLVFPRRFTGDERRVRLEGEAFFEVTGDASRPFVVETGEMEVRVLGTSFNVSAYPDEATRHATLVAGSVEVHVPGQSPIALSPGEQARGREGAWEKRAVDVQRYISWMTGKFSFKDTGLEEIARQLSRWYDVEIHFADERPRTIRFTGGIVRYHPLEELIRMIEDTSDARFRVEGERLVIDYLANPLRESTYTRDALPR